MKYTLDTDAIRKRFAEAIVINWCGDRTDILIPYERGYINLSTGSPWDDDMLRDVDWIIRPGDRCEVSGDNNDWHEGIYGGCEGWGGGIKFALKNGNWYRRIRPLPAPAAKPNPDLEQARARIENAERELSEARAALERAQK